MRNFGGTKKLADALNVSRPSVQNWLAGYCNPSAPMLIEILKLAEGKLSADDILKVGR